MSANDNVQTMASALAAKFVEAHTTEMAAQSITMVALCRYADRIKSIGDGFMELGAPAIAKKLYDGANLVGQAVIDLGNDMERKKLEASEILKEGILK